MNSLAELQSQVKRRAGGRCEYCRMHQSLQGATFHLEHVVPRSRAGDSTLENLAWACPGCNLHKSDRIEVNDPLTGDLVGLYNPRTDRWNDHFRFEDYHVVPLTSIGRAAASALDFNHPRRILIRQAEAFFHLFPPPDS